jgi:predicted RNA-binding protein with RPS1 domain
LSNPETPNRPLDGEPNQSPIEFARTTPSEPATPPASTEEPTPESVAPRTASDEAPSRPAAPEEAAPRPAPPVRAPYISREERDRRRREALAGLVIGEWREGKVTGIAAFGAFVDLGGVDGLVHVSQLGTGGYVERVEDVVQVGQVVKVRIAEVDMDRGRVSLSMREARPSAPSSRPDRPGPMAPRPPRPAGAAPAPAWTPETPPEHRPDRRSRTGPDRPTNFVKDDRPPRRSDRARKGREQDDQEWRNVRGDARGFYSFSDDEAEEPAPTTAEELVARFGRRENNRE